MNHGVLYITCSLLLVGALMTVSGCNDQTRFWGLERNGKVVEGDRVKGWTTSESRSGSSYGYDVRFRPEGGKLTTAFVKVPRDYFATHQDPRKNKVMVRYLPHNPQVAMIDGVGGGIQSKLLVGLVSFVLGLALGYRLLIPS